MSTIHPDFTAASEHYAQLTQANPDPKRLWKARWELYKALDQPETTSASSGQRRRARLSLLTARYVLPYWHQQEPNDDTVQQTLSATEGMLHHAIAQQAAVEDAQLAWAYVRDWGDWSSAKGVDAIMAGLAAARSLFVAADDERLVKLAFTYHTYEPSSIVRVAEAHDTAYYAAVACANDAPYPENQSLKDFWLWWATDAVPAVYNDTAVKVSSHATL